jgi:hypothetical protein
MNGDTDQSMQMRLIDLLFRSTFTKIVSDVDNEEISEIVKILEGYLDNKTKNPTL